MFCQRMCSSKIVRYTYTPWGMLVFAYARFLFQIDEQMRTMYEQTMKEWQGCEAIVRQREREKHAEALARCSSGASVERGPVQRDSTISTDASLTFSIKCAALCNHYHNRQNMKGNCLLYYEDISKQAG